MKIQYRDMTEKDVADVLSISYRQFGQTYLSESELRGLLSAKNCHLPVVTIDGKLVGYSIIHMIERSELGNFLSGEYLHFFDDLEAEKGIQFRRSTAIHPDFSGKGIGLDFIGYTMKKYAKYCDVVMSLNWKRKDLIPMEKISKKLGMTLYCELPNYWMKDSLDKKYECPECGKPPCTCKAVIFYRKIE